jgi:VWFA-related protein
VKRYCPFLACGLALAWTAAAQSTPDGSPTQSQTAPSPARPPAAPDQKSAEVATHDTPATFKVRVNLVLVRVVVRDEKGNVVENLHREDFALADGRKPQVISFFNVETPAARSMPVTTVAGTSAETPGATSGGPVPAIPQRFVSILYDDTHMAMEDAVTVRAATTKLFGALAATDRVGIFTTSGQTTQDFTSDQEAVKRALYGIIPRPLFGHITGGDCPDVTYYQADLIMNKNEQQAMDAAVQETVDCAFNGDSSKTALARPIAAAAAARALTNGDAESEFAYRHIEDALRRLAAMPGQRVMVFVSPGFIIAQLFTEASAIIDRATRANIVIDTIDARGLYTPDVMGDIANPPGGLTSKAAGIKALYRTTAQSVQSEILDEFAAGTGGTYFHNRNDLDAGLRQAVAAPAVSYVLGFSPQNLKLNGGYHTLKVTLTGKQKYSVQARRGYFAPRKAQDPVETAKQEIQEAIFSQDEIGDLPVDLQTQFFKPDPSQAKLSVLAHLDLKSVRFRKADGRNRNDITLATAIFDENGNLVTGGEKIVEMRLLDGTMERLERSGINVKSSFDVKPGSYLVRLVVRDAEGEQMAAKNGAVVIPN